MDINFSINLLRLSAFEKDLENSNVSFAYSDDTLVTAGLIADEKRMFEEYALEVYNICTGGLNLGCQVVYDEFLKVMSEMKGNTDYYYSEYHYYGKGTYKSFMKTQQYKELLDKLTELQEHICFELFNVSYYPYGFIKYVYKEDYFAFTPSFFDRKNRIIGVSDEVFLWLLLKTNEIMNSYNFYLIDLK